MANYDKDGKVIIAPIEKDPKRKGGKGPRQAGNRVEKIVARAVGGDRVPGSGSIKNTNHNLKGDVEVKDTKGRQFVKLEVKMSGAITSKGEKTFPLTKGITDQARKEAEEVGEIAAVVVHYKGSSVDDALVVLPMPHFQELLNYAKAGHGLI